MFNYCKYYNFTILNEIHLEIQFTNFTGCHFHPRQKNNPPGHKANQYTDEHQQRS